MCLQNDEFSVPWKKSISTFQARQGMFHGQGGLYLTVRNGGFEAGVSHMDTPATL